MSRFKYFDIDEFACKETGENGIKDELIHCLDMLREKCGFPFVITSGYRSERHALEMAKEKYKNIHSLTTGRFRRGDLYVKSFYMLGKIYEQQGNTAKAIEHYEKFLDLWKDADPGIAEVEDAKERLAGLKG